jgi:hypothetical protein
VPIIGAFSFFDLKSMENNHTAVKNKQCLKEQSRLTSKIIYTKLTRNFIAKKTTIRPDLSQ